jgi:hypothetical protein
MYRLVMLQLILFSLDCESVSLGNGLKWAQLTSDSHFDVMIFLGV